MTTSVSLIRVGNSNAIIIPAKILKQLNVKETTRFEMTLDESSTIHIRKKSSPGDPVFPKVAVKKMTDESLMAFMDGLATLDPVVIENDERAAYILGR